MAEVLRRWPELRADMDSSVEARGDFVALRDRVATDDLPRFEKEFKNQLNKNAIQELAGFNNWLNRQASAIDERVARINEALGAVPYNPGRYIRLEKEPTNNSDVALFRADLRNLTNDSLVVDGDQYSEQRFLDVKRIIERFRGRDGYAESDKAWTRRVTDVRNWFVFSASERDIETHDEWEHYSDSDGKSGGQKEKLAYTILAASLAYQFGLEWGVAKSKDFRFAVIDEAFGRGSDASTRYALELFAKLGLQLLIITPLQKVHVIEPYVKAIGFVDNPTGTFSRLETMTIEEYRARRDGRAVTRDLDDTRRRRREGATPMGRRLPAARLRRRSLVGADRRAAAADPRPPRSGTTWARRAPGWPGSTPAVATTPATRWSGPRSAAATSDATGCPRGQLCPPSNRRGRCSACPATSVVSTRSSLSSSRPRRFARGWSGIRTAPSSSMRRCRRCWLRTCGWTSTGARTGTCARSAPPASTPSSPSATDPCWRRCSAVPATTPGFLAGLGSATSSPSSSGCGPRTVARPAGSAHRAGGAGRGAGSSSPSSRAPRS